MKAAEKSASMRIARFKYPEKKYFGFGENIYMHEKYTYVCSIVGIFNIIVGIQKESHILLFR